MLSLLLAAFALDHTGILLLFILAIIITIPSILEQCSAVK
jgi:hypothetical protein